MASIADVYVTVLPETGKIAEGIKTALVKVDDIARDAAQRWKTIIKKELEDIEAEIDADVNVDAAQIEKEVEKEARKRKPKVKAEVEPDKESMSKLQKAAEGLLGKLDMDVDEQVILNKIKKLQADIQKKMSTIGVTEHVGVAENELRKLRSEVARLLSHIDVEVDTDLAERALQGLDGHTVKVEVDADPTRNLQRGLYGMFGPGNINKFAQTVEVEVEVDFDKENAEKKLKEIQREAAYILSRIGIDLDAKAAMAKLNQLRQQSQTIIGKLDLDINEKRALAQLHGLHPSLDVETNVDHDALGRVAAEISTVLAEEGAQAGASMFQKIYEGISDQASRLTQLHPAIAVGVVGTVAGLIGDLVVVAAELSGAIALIPAVAVSAVAAFGTLKLATQGFSDALKNMGDPEKFATSLQSLTPAAQQAALSIKAIMDNAITPLQNQLQETLFTNVGPQLVGVINAILPAITPGLNGIAAAFNSMFSQIATLLQDPETVVMISAMVDNIATAFQLLAPGVSAFLDALLRLGEVGSGFLPGLAESLTNAAQSFADFIAEASANGSLQEFIQGSIDAFAQLLPLIPQLLAAFEEMGPLGEAILPGLVDWLTVLIDCLPVLAGILVTIGPNFVMVSGTIRGIGEAFNWIQGVIGPVIDWCKGVFNDFISVVDGLGGPVQAFADLISIVFPGISGVVQSHTGLASQALGGLQTVIEGIMSPLRDLIGLLNLIPGVNIPGGNNVEQAQTVYDAAGGDPAAADDGKGGATVKATGPDANGNIPGTSIPWTGITAPTDTTLSGAPGAPGPDVRIPRNQDRPRYRGSPAAAPPPGPVPTGPYAVPAPPPPKVTGGGGSKPDAVSPVPGAGYDYTGFGELNWEALAQQESGGNWSMNTGNGFYGGLQFVQSTWERYGGLQFAKRADLADKADQIKVATALYNAEGPAPWPANGWLLTATPEQLNAAGLTGTGRQSTSAGTNGRGNYGSSGGGGAGALEQFAQSQAGAAYGWGGEGIGSTLESGAAASRTGGLYDCSGFMSDLYAIVTGKPYQGNERYFTTESNFESLGFTRGFKAGAFNIGVNTGVSGAYSAGAHTAGTLPNGVNVEASGSGVLYGGNAKGAMDFREQYHIDVAPGDSGYNGPGGDRNNPMYTEDAKDSGGKQLGKDILSGVMEIFGLGDLFKDPTQFGLFKIFKGLMGLKPADDQGNGSGSSSSSDGGGDFFGGGGGGAGLVDLLTGFMPSASGSNSDSLLNLIPGIAPPEAAPAPSPQVFDALDEVLKPKKKQDGGPIPGTGSGDTVPIMAEPGEHMLTRGDVKAMGGHSSVYRLRAALRGYRHGGRIRPLPPGGAGGDVGLSEPSVGGGTAVGRGFVTIPGQGAGVQQPASPGAANAATSAVAGFFGSAWNAAKGAANVVANPVQALRSLMPLAGLGGAGAPGVGESWKQTGKALTHWDQWSTDPWGAAGATVFDAAALAAGGGLGRTAAATDRIAAVPKSVPKPVNLQKYPPYVGHNIPINPENYYRGVDVGSLEALYDPSGVIRGMGRGGQGDLLSFMKGHPLETYIQGGVGNSTGGTSVSNMILEGDSRLPIVQPHTISRHAQRSGGRYTYVSPLERAAVESGETPLRVWMRSVVGDEPIESVHQWEKIFDSFPKLGYKMGGRTKAGPAMLHDKEFVQRASAVDKYGLPFMNAINEGRLPEGMDPSLLSLIPQPYGELNVGSPKDAPGEFIPGMSGGGGGSVADFLTGFIPNAVPGPGQQGGTDNSFHVNFGDTKADTGDVMTALDDYYLQHSRSNLNSVPTK